MDSALFSFGNLIRWYAMSSATLCLFKVESGINGLLPTSWVPSIYSVSRLSRLRSALGRLLPFVFDSPSLVPRCGLSAAKAVGTCSGSQTRRKDGHRRNVCFIELASQAGPFGGQEQSK